jgi:hypothetical protein
LIFVDSNIPMYLIGAAHPHKTDAQIILERLIAARQRLVTDAAARVKHFETPSIDI